MFRETSFDGRNWNRYPQAFSKVTRMKNGRAATCSADVYALSFISSGGVRCTRGRGNGVLF